ncbi:pyrroline-5-carboxylate reductase family protein [Ochrobactrum chromiisoli]|uniref:Pyrroline-5-carboxylate reductase n=1 Tax=Ochrobactrum chromiisoli TaxID=2993941 RepID=A0ABT3QSM9_9HYPH|nr:pyrroline-5-carboxylate reductase dimerization domain-containing protein [Ochrobactrum chromiisoli]MCX2698567.1 NAD(P)-binding domain-containing protein [Ochrobactrum chromiisoli]
MTINARLGVIGGTGWLGKAIIHSLFRRNLLDQRHLSVASRTLRKELWPAARHTTDCQELVDNSDIVILSVRPEQFSSLKAVATDTLMISVMAGVSMQAIQETMSSQRVVRALPNAAAAVGQSYTPWIANSLCSEDDRKQVRLIFDACGVTDELKNEQSLDYLAAVTGTGPAYPALLAEALRKDAIKNGIPPEIAQRAMNALLVGTGHIIESTGKNTSEIVSEYLHYQGMTSAALEAMEHAAIDDLVRKGVAAALSRAVMFRS